MTTPSLSPGLRSVVGALAQEVVLHGLPTDVVCRDHDGACPCPEGLPRRISEHVTRLVSESVAGDDWRRPLVWLALLRGRRGWEDLNETARDLFDGELHWALAHHLPRSRLAASTQASIAEIACTLLEERQAAARDRGGPVGEILVRALARLIPIAGRDDALDVLWATFGRPLHEWSPDHADTVLEYHVRASATRDYGGAGDATTIQRLEGLRTELQGCLEHGRVCAKHGGPAWGPAFRQALADTERHLAETRPVNDRIALALSARDHLVAALSTPGISVISRINSITEWGGLHRMPQDRAGHRRLQRDEVELVRDLERRGHSGGTPMLVEALLRRGRDQDRNDARELLASLDVDTDVVHPYHFYSLFPSASKASLDDLADLLGTAAPGTVIDWPDNAGRLYDAWSARHAVDVSLQINMARHCLKAYELGADLSMIARAATLALRAYEVSVALPPGTPALSENARQILSIFLAAHDRLDGVGPETLAEIAEWALRVTPPDSYYRPELEILAASVLSRGDDDSERQLELLRSGWEGFIRRGEVAKARDAAVEYAIARLTALRGQPDEVRAAGARALLDEFELTAVPRDDRIFIRAHLVIARCHDLIHRTTHHERESALDQAVQHQSTALREIQRRRGQERNEALASAMTLTFRVDRRSHPEDARLLTRVLVEATEARIGIRDSLWALSQLLNGVGSTCDLDDAEVGAGHAFSQLYRTMDHLVDSRTLLAKIQGWAYHLAGLLVDAGDVDGAGRWLEMGSAVILRQQVDQAWQRGGAQPVLSARPAVYLAARDDDGYALVWDGGEITRVVTLPALTRGAARDWREALSTGRAAAARRVRSLETDCVADGPAVGAALNAIGAAVEPLLTALADGYPDLKDWIPCGELSGLPWAAAVLARGARGTLPCVQASLTARQIAFERARARLHTVGVAALTNPRPCTLEGRALPDLPGATREGRWLRDHVSAVVHDGSDAARQAFDEVTSRDLKVLHLAMHGAVESGVLGGTLLYLPNDPEDRSTSVSTRDLAEARGGARLVWLGACWAGQPNSLLPDESHGLVTSVVHHLGSTVVAPLWPVDDTIAAEFAEDFYQSWLLEGVPIEEAFRRAMLYARSLDDHGSWAAFTLIGAGSSQDERDAFSRR